MNIRSGGFLKNMESLKKWLLDSNLIFYNIYSLRRTGFGMAVPIDPQFICR